MNEEYALKCTGVTKLGQTVNTRITIQNGLDEKNLCSKHLHVLWICVRILIIHVHTHTPMHTHKRVCANTGTIKIVAISNNILKDE